MSLTNLAPTESKQYYAELDKKAAAMECEETIVLLALHHEGNGVKEISKEPFQVSVYGKLFALVPTQIYGIWNVTHVLTGYGVRDWADKAHALRYIYRLLNTQGMDWDFTEPDQITPATAEVANRIAREIVEERVPGEGSGT